MAANQISINHSDAFATRLWSVELPHLHVNELKWIQEIEKLMDQSKGVQKSNRFGWQSQSNLSSNEIFAPLFSDVSQIFRALLDMMSPNIDFQLEAWVNVNATGSLNSPHTHPVSLLSAVYYFQVPENSGDIYFKDPRPGAAHSYFHGGPNACPPNCSADIRITPKQNMLLIFPSWLEHGVHEHQGVGRRISIALNAELKKAS
jgi:uncharacterized protein (TIGR02466 family)